MQRLSPETEIETINDIRIIGLDDSRLPMITKSPYIDVYFKMSQKVPSDWCSHFNNLVSKNKYKPRMEEEDRLYIKSWVRKADEIPAMLEQLMQQVSRCNADRVAAIKAARQAASSAPAGKVSPEQARLDEILAGLSFEPPVDADQSG